MIYELGLVASADLGEGEISSLTELVRSVVNDHSGEIMLEDDWGARKFAQPTSTGILKGHFLYFIFRGDSKTNDELSRRFKINEKVLKSLFVKLGEEKNGEVFMKNYKTPFSKKYSGSVTDSIEDDTSGKRRFARARTCWFTSNKINPDWKDPKTYLWLVNEFGKISPARVSGITVKKQRFATTTIKRARQLGIISHLTNYIAE